MSHEPRRDGPRIDAHLHVRGRAEFVDDVRPPAGMLYAQVVGSPLAHGRLRAIDAAPALALPGVVAVLTASDVPGTNALGPIVQDEELLARERVAYAGQPLALVVATTHEQARAGVRAVGLELEPLPVVTDPRLAFAAGLVFDAPRTVAIGDVEAAWADCDVVVESSCDVGGQEHCYLETQRARAQPTESGGMWVTASTQGPYAVQRAVAAILGLRYHQVEVEVARLGGGFGGKEDQASPWACLAALAAARTGRPVELVLTRADDLRSTGKRHPYQSDFKLGLRRDGTIVALEVRHFQNAGAFTDLSPAVLERTLLHSTNAYRVPHARIWAVSCRTNLPPSTAFRGFGAPQAMFVIESALARAAEVLGMPREELQRRNLLRDGDPFPYGQALSGTAPGRSWDEAARRHDLPALRRAVAAYNTAHVATKMGLAVMPVCFGIAFTKTFMNQAGALVHVYGDGSVSVSTGSVEMGQGVATNLRLIVARGLGIAPDRVRIETTNTRRVANASPSAASATTELNGEAALDAVAQLWARLAARAATTIGSDADPRALAMLDERVLNAGRDTGLGWQTLVRDAYLARIDLSAHGFAATPGLGFDRTREQGHPFRYHVTGTAIVQVCVDVLRGTYELCKVGVVHDLGRSIHAEVDRGQIEGGLVQGLGWMAMEDLRFDAEGRCLTATLSRYKIPDVFFVPDDLTVTLLAESDGPAGPFGAKAVGEPPLMYGIGLHFAVRDALRAARPDAVLPFATPVTPERVLLALHGEAGSASPALGRPSARAAARR